nr:hypothetical protein [Tanacetum cinerariifolium]
EETNTFDNSLPEFQTFCFDVEEISSGSTTTYPDISVPKYKVFHDDHVKEISSGSPTTHSDISLLEYEVFHNDHVKEISSGSPTTHSDSSLYASFMFDLSINPFPPADRSDFYDELIPFISPPEYDQQSSLGCSFVPILSPLIRSSVGGIWSSSFDLKQALRERSL